MDGNLKARRLQSGLSQEMLAIAAGMSRKTIQRIEKHGGGSAETWASIEAVLTARGGGSPESRKEREPVRKPAPSFAAYASKAGEVLRTPTPTAVALASLATLLLVTVLPKAESRLPAEWTTFVACVGEKSIVRDASGILSIDYETFDCSGR